MLITRVELQNIKSYRHAVVTLHPGTTAIRGHNGAGKSTLVEAIGWALFDALPYSQSQFVREGERAGQVTVTFRSGEDDREYQVVRRAGTAPAWYIYDPELDHRPAEQKTDVLDFLRRHLRIEGEIALEALFNDALGVPQGALTADFLLTAANRKKKFDALLQVEEYSRAAEKLRDTRAYVQEAIHAQELEIARLERETAELDDWRADVVARREHERRLGAHLVATQREHDEAAGRRDRLRADEQEVKRLDGARAVARVAWEATERAAATARAQMDEAEEAARICAEARTDHETHAHVEGALAEARRRAQTRDHRLKQRNDLAGALTAATRDLEHARQRLAEADAAAQRVVALAAQVAEQQALIQRREALVRDAARLQDAQVTARAREADIVGLTTDLTSTGERIAAIEAERPEANLFQERRERLEALQAAQATRAERERLLRSIGAELTRTRSKRTKVNERVARSAENVAKLEARREMAERLPVLHEEHERLRGEAERLRAAIAQHQESRTQSVGGQCPFLREPCQNIRQRGLTSLDTYFDRLIQRDDARLAPLQERLDALAPALDQAREAAQWYGRLDEYREQHSQARQELAEQDERLVALDAERAELTASLAALGSDEDLAAARALFERSVEADRRMQELGPLQKTVETARRRLAAAEVERVGAGRLVAELSAAPVELKATIAALDKLGDPRADSARAEGLARQRPEIEAELRRHETVHQAAAARLAQADEALVPFAGLDKEIAELEARLSAAGPGHQRYLQHEQTARRLPERRAALATAEAEAAAAAQTHAAAAKAQERALRSFDAKALEAVTVLADKLHAELSRATQELKSLQELLVQREADIARAEAMLGDLAAARAEHTTLSELFQMLEQFRATIKEAGPYVMRALLRQISTEANRIFGEIIGDRSGELAWEDDYEIVLRRSGQERHFAQLSGGEQMSAALAVRLALLRSLSRLDIAFFDEPTQNMDGERRGNLAEQLRRVHGFDQLVVISHDDTFEQGLDSVIHLEQRGGETVLVEADALVGV